jgi:hypothetical protein
MLFSDYIKYFEATYINQIEESTKYYNEELLFDQGEQKHGLLYRLQVETNGAYTISIDQNDMASSNSEPTSDGWSRSTILIIRDNSSKVLTEFEYVSGILKYNEQHPSLKVALDVGNYLIYVKLDPTLKAQSFPSKVNVVLYSSHSARLKQLSKKDIPDLVKMVFLTHGRSNKRQHYNNDLMWSAWKLISQGGYAYLAFGNASESKFKFKIKVDKE